VEIDLMTSRPFPVRGIGSLAPARACVISIPLSNVVYDLESRRTRCNWPTVLSRDPESAEVISLLRWRATCAALGLGDCDRQHRKLLRAWGSWGRYYHTVDHLQACLAEFDGARSLAQHPAEVQLALWFHDAVYRTYRGGNELRSAEWAAQFLAEHGAGASVVSNVRQFVLATAHAPGALAGDAALVVDIDLAILGQPQPSYDQFERNVRNEYWWVPRRRFVMARSRILQSFLARPFIYHWPSFRERYEAAARVNLERAIRALSHAWRRNSSPRPARECQALWKRRMSSTATDLFHDGRDSP
jgi:predicted metal-dependent HD superfamily phosphohydrolase